MLGWQIHQMICYASKMATINSTASLEEKLTPMSYLIYALASVQPKRPLGGEYKMGASHTVRWSYHDTVPRKTDSGLLTRRRAYR